MDCVCTQLNSHINLLMSGRLLGRANQAAPEAGGCEGAGWGVTEDETANWQIALHKNPQ